MSSFVIAQEEATRIAKRLKKNIQSKLGVEDITLSEAQHILAKSLGAKNWQSLDFNVVSKEDIEDVALKALTPFLFKLEPEVWVDDEAVGSDETFEFDGAAQLIKLTAQQIRELEDNQFNSDDLLSTEDSQRLLGHSQPFAVRDIEESFVEQTGKSHKELSDLEIIFLKSALSNHKDLWLPCDIRSDYKQGKPYNRTLDVTSVGRVNISTGIVQNFDKEDYTTKPSRQTISISGLDIHYAHQVNVSSSTPKIDTLRLNNPTFCFDTYFLRDFAEWLSSAVEKASDYDYGVVAVEIDQAVDDYADMKTASIVNNSGFIEQIEFLCQKAGLVETVERVCEAFDVKKEDVVRQ